MSASPMGGDPHPLVAITEARKQKEEALKNIFDMMKQSLSELGPTRESERALDEFQTRSKYPPRLARSGSSSSQTSTGSVASSSGSLPRQPSTPEARPPPPARTPVIMKNVALQNQTKKPLSPSPRKPVEVIVERLYYVHVDGALHLKNPAHAAHAGGNEAPAGPGAFLAAHGLPTTPLDVRGPIHARHSPEEHATNPLDHSELDPWTAPADDAGLAFPVDVPPPRHVVVDRAPKGTAGTAAAVEVPRATTVGPAPAPGQPVSPRPGYRVGRAFSADKRTPTAPAPAAPRHPRSASRDVRGNVRAPSTAATSRARTASPPARRQDAGQPGGGRNVSPQRRTHQEALERLAKPRAQRQRQENPPDRRVQRGRPNGGAKAPREGRPSPREKPAPRPSEAAVVAGKKVATRVTANKTPGRPATKSPWDQFFENLKRCRMEATAAALRGEVDVDLDTGELLKGIPQVQAAESKPKAKPKPKPKAGPVAKPRPPPVAVGTDAKGRPGETSVDQGSASVNKASNNQNQASQSLPLAEASAQFPPQETPDSVADVAKGESPVADEATSSNTQPPFDVSRGSISEGKLSGVDPAQVQHLIDDWCDSFESDFPQTAEDLVQTPMPTSIRQSIVDQLQSTFGPEHREDIANLAHSLGVEFLDRPIITRRRTDSLAMELNVKPADIQCLVDEWVRSFSVNFERSAGNLKKVSDMPPNLRRRILRCLYRATPEALLGRVVALGGEYGLAEADLAPTVLPEPSGEVPDAQLEPRLKAGGDSTCLVPLHDDSDDLALDLEEPRLEEAHSPRVGSPVEAHSENAAAGLEDDLHSTKSEAGDEHDVLKVSEELEEDVIHIVVRDWCEAFYEDFPQAAADFQHEADMPTAVRQRVIQRLRRSISPEHQGDVDALVAALEVVEAETGTDDDSRLAGSIRFRDHVDVFPAQEFPQSLSFSLHTPDG